MAPGIWVAGVDETRAPVAVREALLAATRSAGGPAQCLRLGTGLDDAVLLATCRRFEVFAGASDEQLEWTLRWLESLAGRPLGNMLKVRRGREAARHVFRAAAGLQAWLSGDEGAAARVNQAYRDAYSAGTVGPCSHRVFQRAQHVARCIRDGPGRLGFSRSAGESAAHWAHRAFARSTDRSIVVVGTGAAARSALRHLAGQGVTDWTVCGRTSEHAAELAARLGGSAADLRDLPEVLARAAVAIFATAAESPLLDADAARSVMKRRGGRALVAIDLGVPRNVAPGAGMAPGLRLCDLDSFRRLTRRMASDRPEKLRRAEQLVEERSDEFAVEWPVPRQVDRFPR